MSFSHNNNTLSITDSNIIVYLYSLIMYNMIPHSIGPGMDPLSFLVISSSIDLVQSVSIHSSAKNSALCDANASNAVQQY